MEDKYLSIIKVLTDALNEANKTINLLLDKKNSSKAITVSKLDDILTVLKHIREDHKPLSRQDILGSVNDDHSDSSK